MKIMAAVDGSEQQQDALALAAQLAELEGAELLVAHVYPFNHDSVLLGSQYSKTIREDAERLMTGAVAGLGRDVAETVLVPDFSAPRGLHRAAREHDVDLVVIGSCHRGSVGRVLLGGTGERLLHGAPCAVAVAPKGHRAPEGGLKTVGVAYDGGEEARAALNRAQEVAAAAGATLTIISVVEPIQLNYYPGAAIVASTELLEDLRRDRRTELDEVAGRVPDGLDVRTELLDGPVATVLAEAAHGFDLLFCGSRGYGAVGTVLLGGVSHVLVRDAPCPVVVLPRTGVPAAAA
jgi:nucleotide-binding universal stress UspA family protein